ncbi:MAG: citrate transporter [Clostridia bacterium]|nr:citrate transporter [Clostridia bacterium]
MKKILGAIKKEPMLVVSVLAAVISLFITPPSAELLRDIDWRTLGTLFLMLTVLEGFKSENIFNPVLRLAGKMKSVTALSFFLVFSVFFSSMFVTNDVSLIIFVPLTMILFRAAGKEQFILPLLAMENIAAVRGSLLTPFGSPQNLFIYGQSGVGAARFIWYMFPAWIISAALLCVFILALNRKDLRGKPEIPDDRFPGSLPPERRWRRIVYLILFACVLVMIVTRTSVWMYIVLAVALFMLFFDRKILLKTDYVLILTFFCFFVFSSSLARNEKIAEFLSRAVAGREYFGSIIVSQVISNVPAAIVLYPFAENKGALLYGLDTAGLCTIIGSLASVINYRIYVREYPGKGRQFLKYFMIISLIFFALVAVPGYFISRAGL